MTAYALARARPCPGPRGEQEQCLTAEEYETHVGKGAVAGVQHRVRSTHSEIHIKPIFKTVFNEKRLVRS